MAGQDLAAFGPAQKLKYIGAIQTVVNSKQVVTGWIPKETSEDGGGAMVGSTGPSITTRSVNFPVHLGRNDVGGFHDPEVAFTSAGSERYKQGIMQGRTGYWPTQVSIAAVARTKTDAAAYARVMAESAVRAGNNFRNTNERIIMGDGSGTLGVCGTVPACGSDQCVIPLDNFQDARKFSVGMFVNFWTARTAGATQRTVVTGGTGTTNIAKVVAVTVSGSTATVTFGTATGTWTTTNVVAGDVITKANDSNSTTYNGARAASVRYEPMGLAGITLDCDTPMENGATIAGLFGINATTQYAAPSTATAGSSNSGGELGWQAYNSRSATGRSINNSILQSLRDMPTINFGEAPNLYIVSFGGRFEYVNTLLGIRRNINTTSVAGGNGGGFKENIDAKSLSEYDDTPVLPSRYAPTYPVSGSLCASVLAVNLNYLKIHEWHPLRFIDYDGQTWRMVPTSTGFSPNLQAILEHTWELKTTARNAHAAAHAILASDFT